MINICKEKSKTEYEKEKIQTNRFNYSQSQQNPLQYPQEFLQLQDLTSPMDQPIQEAEANKKMDLNIFFFFLLSKMDLNIDSTKGKRKIS